MEDIDSIAIERDGATTIVTKSNIRLTLSPKAAAELAELMVGTLPTTVKLTRFGYTLKVEPPKPN